MQIVQGENIQHNLKLLDSIQFIGQNTDCKLCEKEQDTEPQKTPFFNLTCCEHNTEIVLLDLNDKRKGEDRLAYLYCQYDQFIKYTPIKIAEKQWNQYQQEKNNEITKIEEQQKLIVTRSIEMLHQAENVFKKEYQKQCQPIIFKDIFIFFQIFIHHIRPLI